MRLREGGGDKVQRGRTPSVLVSASDQCPVVRALKGHFWVWLGMSDRTTINRPYEYCM